MNGHIWTSHRDEQDDIQKFHSSYIYLFGFFDNRKSEILIK